MWHKGKKIVLFIIFVILALAFFGLMVKWLWNWLLPELFDVPAISFYQAIGLLLLSKILFSGFGHKKSHGHKKDWWKDKIKRKLSKMSDEERQQFKEKMRSKWGKCRDEPGQPPSGSKEAN